MRLLRFTPVLWLALAAWGCGVDRKLIAPTSSGPDPASGALALAESTAASDVADPLHFSGHGGQDGVRALYTLSNSVAGNAVLAYRRAASGELSGPTATPTGGNGTGGGLGDQGALIVSAEDGLLFAVDAGSNDVAALRVTRRGLQALGTTPSGGTRPISVTRHDDLVFVLNAGGDGNIAGFRVGHNGRLRAIPGTLRGLGGPATGPAQVSFTPDGEHLIVTEKTANAIAVFDVGRDGSVSHARVQPSAGQTPFGFDFARWGTLVVSEAVGGAPGQSSASSYRVGRRGALSLVSGPVPTHQTAACWVAVPRGGDFAYTSNAASNTISGFRVRRDGSLALIDAGGETAHADGTPLDAAFDASGEFFYVLSAGTHSLNAYRRMGDGHLSPLGGAAGLPAAAVGLAAL